MTLFNIHTCSKYVIVSFYNALAGGLTPQDLIQRVNNLESRLLQLEGRSHEYEYDDVSASLPICAILSHCSHLQCVYVIGFEKRGNFAQELS